MGGKIERITIACTPAVGEDGVATVTVISTAQVEGTIRAIYLEYLASPPAATADVTISEAYNSPAQSLLTVTNGATDGWRYPMAQADNQAGTDITNQGAPIVVHDYIKVVLAQVDANDGVNVTIVYER